MLNLEYSALGIPVSDADAEGFITLCVYEGDDAVVSTSNVFLAARAMIKRGDIKHTDICFRFNDKILLIDEDGRLPEWPKGFCDLEDKWLVQLL